MLIIPVQAGAVNELQVKEQYIQSLTEVIALLMKQVEGLILQLAEIQKTQIESKVIYQHQVETFVNPNKDMFKWDGISTIAEPRLKEIQYCYDPNKYILKKMEYGEKYNYLENYHIVDKNGQIWETYENYDEARDALADKKIWIGSTLEDSVIIKCDNRKKGVGYVWKDEWEKAMAKAKLIY